jgi:cell division protein FtsB
MLNKLINLIKEKVRSYSEYLLILLSVLLVISLARNILKITSADKKIEESESELEELKIESQELKVEVKALQSEEHIEEQLRDKLGLAKEGEIVLVLPDEEILKKLAPRQVNEEEALPNPLWKKWLDLFF